jgi:hypothetical protein
MTNVHVQSLMQKEMSRQEFIGVLVLAVLSVFGFGQVVKLFTGKSLADHKSLRGLTSATKPYGK